MMDKSKEPGISFESIFVVSSNFKRESIVSNDISLNFSMNIDQNFFSSDECDIVFGFKVEGESIEEPGKIDFIVETVHVAKFKVDEESPNMELEKFILNSAPAIMFPYIRNHIHSMTMNSGMKPVLLAPLNITKMIKEAELNSEGNN